MGTREGRTRLAYCMLQRHINCAMGCCCSTAITPRHEKLGAWCSWGIVDVDDCSNAAKYLAEQGLVDPKRLCITGGSAGGYTTLACLAFR